MCVITVGADRVFVLIKLATAATSFELIYHSFVITPLSNQQTSP